MKLFSRHRDSVVDEKVVGGMTRPQKIAVILFVVMTMFAIGFLIVATMQIKDRAERGEQYVTTIAPNSPGIKGEKGDQGPPPTADQVKQAVYQYCAETGVCDGHQPSLAAVFAAVTQYCDAGSCKGDDGANGRDATPAQIQSAVSSYCANGNCKGEAGDDGAVGATGATGPAGSSGRSPVLACVIRTVNNTMTRFTAWKYTDEPDQSYRDLYKLPTWAECNAPIDLR